MPDPACRDGAVAPGVRVGTVRGRSRGLVRGEHLPSLAAAFRPTLTVVDAVRILPSHGPTGGSLSYVKKMDTVIASHDVVAADAYATTLFGLTGADLPSIKEGAAMGLLACSGAIATVLGNAVAAPLVEAIGFRVIPAIAISGLLAAVLLTVTARRGDRAEALPDAMKRRGA